MDKKKWIIIITTSLVVLVVLLTFLFFFREDKKTTLTLSEKSWIESKKNETFRLEIMPDIYMLNKDGSGIFFDFLNAFEKDTKLKFHRGTSDGKNNSDYILKRVPKASEEDILFYQDTYVLVSKNKLKYTSLADISSMVVGVMESNLEDTNTYLRTDNLTYKTYESFDSLVSSLGKEVNAIVLSKLDYFKYYNNDNNIYINYNIVEMTEDYVIKLSKKNENNTLNTILNKYYKKWVNENYQSSYNTHLTNAFFEINKIDEQSKVKFRSKRYIYGYVENPPYDKTINDEDYGINPTIINNFANIAKIEIAYEKYSSNKELEKAFGANQLDFYFSNDISGEYDMDIYETVSPFEEKIVVSTKVGKKLSVNSIKSLANKTVSVLKWNVLNDYLTDNNVKIKTYNDSKNLIKKVNKDSILVMDLNSYNYYSKNELSKYKIDFQTKLKNAEYKYIIRNIQKNEVFLKYFDFYLSFINEKDPINEGYYQALNITNSSLIFKIVIIGLSLLIISLLGLFIFKKIPNKKKSLTKEDKLKFVDILTSLKNRNYLNDNIEKWDESEIYPQTIIIIDLNNVAYINDNYGHAEGDNVIREAANILITNQMPNSEIIRTNGNEFLIYLVEYDEKQIVSYIKKLTKELKELSHGFGAAIGYSMINDAIKTIDDAVNEATLDMRNNKEELNN